MNRANVVRLLIEAAIGGYWYDARYFARSLKRSTPRPAPLFLWTPTGSIPAPKREPRS